MDLNIYMEDRYINLKFIKGILKMVEEKEMV